MKNRQAQDRARATAAAANGQGAGQANNRSAACTLHYTCSSLLVFCTVQHLAFYNMQVHLLLLVI